MGTEHSHSIQAKLISFLCLFVLGSIAVAGLWPFRVPRNAVSWLTDKNGLRFSGHGSAVSAGAFRASPPPNDTGCSLEILLAPARTTGGGSSILAFDSSPDPRAPFLLQQNGTSLAVQRYVVDDLGNATRRWFEVDQVLEAGKQVFVTVTSSKDNVALYINGVLARRSDSGIVSRELTGRLVLANSTVDDSWTGQILGLAIYSRELTPAQVKKHFQSWTMAQEPSLTGEQALAALYLFNERSGNLVHNQVDPATNLILPPKYFVLHPALLLSTWDQYSHAGSVWRRWSFWKDLGVNVCGFVPFGFVFLAYFSSVWRIGHPALVVVVMGLFLSLSVEVLQRFLPNRDSGMTDLLTNTAGTALGVLLYRSSSGQRLWKKVLASVVPSAEAGVARCP